MAKQRSNVLTLPYQSELENACRDASASPLLISEAARRTRLWWRGPANTNPDFGGDIELAALYEALTELEMSARSESERLSHARHAYLLALDLLR